MAEARTQESCRILELVEEYARVILLLIFGRCRRIHQEKALFIFVTVFGLFFEVV